MKSITFITGNQHKADYLAKYLGYPVDHIKIDVEEIQSTDLSEIVHHKVLTAYKKIHKPVIVEDVSLEFSALGGLPGPFIKFFIEKMSLDALCRLCDHATTRAATARCVFGYFDGKDVALFEGYLNGTIAQTPSGERGYSWDQIFIPEGYTVPRAALSEQDDQKTYVQLKPFASLRAFLEARQL